MDNDVAKNNSDIWGTVDSKQDYIDLLVINERGLVQNASQTLDATGSKRRFGTRMGRNNARAFPIGILFMVVTSQQRIDALSIDRPIQARQFFDKLKPQSDKVAVDVRYLKLID